METCRHMLIKEVTDIGELRLVLHEAANDNHRNADNYQFEKMENQITLSNNFKNNK